ncbi:unnamed protein product [Discosporangium mesarthrocarpum]
MFFTPTIAGLVQANEEVFILCLSSGDFYGKGYLRKHELIKACAVLGVSEASPFDRVIIVENPRLQDGAKDHWPAELVASHVKSFVASHCLNTLLTFDSGGVSGHRDHIAVHIGVMHFINHQDGEHPRARLGTGAGEEAGAQARLSERGAGAGAGHGRGSGADERGLEGSMGTAVGRVIALELLSTNLLRKYSGLLDLLWSWTWVARPPQGALFVNLDPRVAWAAMAAHRSQFVWYRRLFVVFSRYAYINTLVLKRQ